MKCDTNRCNAWCCKQFWVDLDVEPNEDMKKYLEFHGIKSKGKRLTIPVKCRYLTKDNKCGIYGKPERPQFCKAWFCRDILMKRQIKDRYMEV